ncbi:MAG: hypothetical protein P1V36_00385 [Planctomycetota bacterium]|nr:hypothetical protein [Planctomycetota bacterium]
MRAIVGASTTNDARILIAALEGCGCDEIVPFAMPSGPMVPELVSSFVSEAIRNGGNFAVVTRLGPDTHRVIKACANSAVPCVVVTSNARPYLNTGAVVVARHDREGLARILQEIVASHRAVGA